MDKDIQFIQVSFNKNLKRKKAPQVITLESDDSDIECLSVVRPRNKNKIQKTNGVSSSKRMRTTPFDKLQSEPKPGPSTSRIIKLDTDDDDFEKETESDYDNIPGYEMRREVCPPPVNVVYARDITAEVETALKKLSLGRVQTRSDPLPIHAQQKYKPFRVTRAYRPRTGLVRDRSREFNTPLKHLYPQCSFRMADACTWISQSGERLLVSSATPGGGESETTRNLYNESNTLAYFQTGSESPEFLPSHHLRGNDPGGDGNPDPRYFDVERACFDPNAQNVFVSAGRDGVVTIWNYATPKIKNLYLDTGDTKFSYVPVRRWGRETYGGSYVHDIVFRKNRLPDTRSIFSAPCRNGNLFLHSYSYDGDQTVDYSRQKLTNKQTTVQNALFGATIWGDYASSDDLFTCTEVRRASLANICHHVYDIRSGKHRYSLDNGQNGEEICLSPDGSMLALFTQRGNILSLDLYDARRKDGSSVAEILEIPCLDKEPGVTKAAWSPDGIHLAVATNDHRVRVYDGRFLDPKKCAMEFYHEVQMERSFSISFMEWTTESSVGQNVGLVTGNGGDNRILLWDTRYSNQAPKVLAQLCCQVSVGCLGDPYKREKPLVIGGLDGWVYAYDTSGLVF